MVMKFRQKSLNLQTIKEVLYSFDLRGRETGEEMETVTAAARRDFTGRRDYKVDGKLLLIIVE